MAGSMRSVSETSVAMARGLVTASLSAAWTGSASTSMSSRVNSRLGMAAPARRKQGQGSALDPPRAEGPLEPVT